MSDSCDLAPGFYHCQRDSLLFGPCVTRLPPLQLAPRLTLRPSVLSLMSSLFDSFFGFIFWGVAYFRMRKADGGGTLSIFLPPPTTAYREAVPKTPTGLILAATNVVIILIGIFFLTVGTYASVQSIIDGFRAGAVGGVFSCASNGL